MRASLVISFPSLFLVFCTNEENVLDNIHYPILETSVNQSASSIKFNAKPVLKNTTGTMEEYGFVWDDINYPTKNVSDWKSLGSQGKLRDFSMDLTAPLQGKKTYYVVAYVVCCQGKTVYGNIVSFKTP